MFLVLGIDGWGQFFKSRIGSNFSPTLLAQGIQFSRRRKNQFKQLPVLHGWVVEDVHVPLVSLVGVVGP
jgi:hypothetical protein